MSPAATLPVSPSVDQAHSIASLVITTRIVEDTRDSGPYEAPVNTDDHRRTSDGRSSGVERKLDAVDLTDFAGYSSPDYSLSGVSTERQAR